MEKINNLSLRKIILFYVIIAQIICFFGAVIVIKQAEKIQKTIWAKYINEKTYREVYEHVDENHFYVEINRPNHMKMNSRELFVSETCDFLETWSSLIFAVFGNMIAIFFFYRDKIKEPLRLLEDGTEQIVKQNLDFEINYFVPDEMGALCKAYEKMRKELQKNYQKMWGMIEEERILRNTISHELRAPLAVLKGYQEMLIEFVTNDMIEKEQILNMLHSSDEQIERISDFIVTISKLDSLENREVKKTFELLSELENELNIRMKILCKDNIDYEICGYHEKDRMIFIDKTIVFEVYENIMINALRYAKRKITLLIQIKENKLSLNLYDDGCGFNEEKEKGEENLCHFGIGLYLCDILCKLHDGRLLTGNRETNGAYVIAEFLIEYQ